MSESRDITSGSDATVAAGAAGRNVIAVIGIDRYHHWQRLGNAVNDAMGAAAVFQRLGFEQVTAPLVDDAATGKAIQSLVTDDLKMLGPDDSLVLFYAGHGGTRRHSLGDKVVKTGYLIPVDASDSPDRVSTWVDLEGWLRTVSLLPARHILVVLDACHSGIALDPIIKWRDIGTWQDVPLPTLQARRSRRIITSALDDQLTLDSGPVHGHSLFTGCLVEGLTEGLRRGGRRVATGSALGLYVQQRVQTYPHSRQTPDFGAFAFDDRGEMVIPLVTEPAPYAGPEPESAAPASAPRSAGSWRQSSVAPPAMPPPAAMAVAPRPEPVVVRVSPDPGARVPDPRGRSPDRRSAWQVSERAWPGIGGIILAGIERAWPGIVGITLAGGLLFAYVIHDRAFGIAAMITASLVVPVTMIGRMIPTAPAVLRWLSERILRRKRWVGGAIVAILVGAALGVRVRGQLQDECSSQLALADGLQQAHRDGAGQAYASAAEACGHDIGRDEDAHRAARVANEWRESETARKAAEQKVAPSPPPPPSGPSCADVLPKLDQYPGLLPPGVPRSAAPHLVQTIPIVVDGEAVLLERDINDGKLVVSRAVGNERQSVHTIKVPPQDGRPFSSFTIAAAVGDKVIGVAVMDGRRGFLLTIDKKTWAVRRMAPLGFAEPSSLRSLEHPHVAFGGGVFGIAVTGDMSAAPEPLSLDPVGRQIDKPTVSRVGADDPWRWAWTTFGEDGRSRSKPMYFDSSHHIEPLVAWTGSSFAVLEGRTDDSEPVSLGVYVMPPKDASDPVYTPWIEASTDRHDQPRLYIGGALVWQDGMLHVAMALGRSMRGETDLAQIVHADLAGHVRVERCPDVKPDQ